jgi:nicotinate-nucleotide adenylyltransferase
MKKIGILGGTFDPVHLGHIGLAQAALHELMLDEVLLMPANKQPFKKNKHVEDASKRLRMIELATSNCERIGVTDIELQSEGLSYTYDTMIKLMKIYPDTEICFILGSDSLLKIESWYKGKELLKLCSFAVGLRPGDDRTMLRDEADRLMHDYGCKVALLEDLMKPISSTAIREHVHNKESISGLVGSEVEEYIYEQGLYT